MPSKLIVPTSPKKSFTASKFNATLTAIGITLVINSVLPNSLTILFNTSESRSKKLKSSSVGLPSSNACFAARMIFGKSCSQSISNRPEVSILLFETGPLMISWSNAISIATGNNS